jgi:hypothetical protein
MLDTPHQISGGSVPEIQMFHKPSEQCDSSVLGHFNSPSITRACEKSFSQADTTVIQSLSAFSQDSRVTCVYISSGKTLIF